MTSPSYDDRHAPLLGRWSRSPDLTVFALFLAASFAGWLAFTSPHAGAFESVPISTVERVGSLFAQLQIGLAAAILLRRLGSERRRAVAIPATAVAVTSLAIEALGVSTGIPFGAYAYGSGLGPHLPGGVPWTIPVSWATAATAAYLLAASFRPGGAAADRSIRVLATSALLLAWDLALDPAMSTLNGFWTWEREGAWYGVPLSNLAGWYLSGLLFAAILETGRTRRAVDVGERSWLTGFVLLQTALPIAMVAAAGMWGAACATVLVGGATFAVLARRPRKARRSGSGDVSEVDALDYMGRNSKSFRFAAAFLAPDLRQRVARVYSWCRVTDDLVDEASHLPVEDLHMRIDVWESLSRGSYEGQQCGIGLVDGLFGEMRALGVPFDHARDLLDGMRMDVSPRRYRDEAELRTYSHRVASSVGAWLVRSLGIEDPWVLERAEALGHAMQLTNILRDVGEDLRMGRVYIPSRDLAEAGIEERDLLAFASGAKTPDGRWKALMESLMERADRDYALAFEAMPSLPPSFRLGVAVAASVYRGIHDEIRANGYDNFRHRAATGPVRKLRLAADALLRLGRVSLSRRAPARAHAVAGA